MAEGRLSVINFFFISLNLSSLIAFLIAYTTPTY